MRNTNLRPIINKELSGKPVVFISTGRVSNPSLEGAHYKPAEIIPTEDVIYDEWTDKKTGEKIKGERTIRYVPGARSIYADEQEEGAEKRMGEIIFYNGMKVVERRETLLLSFLQKCNWNQGNYATRMPNKPVLFKENKLEVNAQDAIDREDADTDAKMAVRTMPVETLVAYAKTLGINTNREVAEIRWDMVVTAKKNPKMFLDGLNNPKMHRKYQFMEAIDMGILIHNSHSNTVGWSNGNILVQARPGENAVDALVDRTFADREGDVIYSEIKNMLNPYMDNKLSTDVVAPEEVLSEEESLLNRCISVGTIDQKAAWLFVGDEKFQRKQLLKDIKSNTNGLKDRLELGLKAPAMPLSL